ncbi:agc kinase [Fusarium longipes]|uniref:Agc kinase n=1 Tax=Fusarium longipes TaxID=694270 RepID=A0A395RHJ1_9HYPO|nr:agc kinase [Fusarium longipes]
MGIRKANSRLEDSPTSGSSIFAGRLGAAMMSSREDSITSSLFGDSESVTTDELPVVVSRKGTNEWDEGGLNITENSDTYEPTKRSIPQLVAQQSAPAQMEHRPRGNDKLKGKREGSEQRTLEGTESADDEDEELGGGREKHHGRNSQQMLSKAGLPSSKLGIEMMRANSHDSLTMGSESTPEAVTQVVTTPSKEMETGVLDNEIVIETSTRTPPDSEPKIEDVTPKPDKDGVGSTDATPRPSTVTRDGDSGQDEEATPKPIGK